LSAVCSRHTLLLLFNQNLRDPRHRELLAVAAQLRDEQKFDYAVVAAQTACEVYAEFVINGLLKARNLGPLEEAILNSVAGYSLRGSRQGLDIFRALTGCDPVPDDKQLWDRYGRHVARRHAVVHRGEEPTRQDADDSVRVAEEWFEYITSAAEGVMAREKAAAELAAGST
jgi:hypothetical protein